MSGENWRIKIPAIEWTAETDSSELAEWEASLWITGKCLGVRLRIGQWTEGEQAGMITLRIMHDKYDDPEWVDTVAYDSVDEAKESAFATVEAVYEGDIWTYYTDKYADALATLRKFDKNAELVDLSAGYLAFWGKLRNGYEVGVSNDDMDGVDSGSQEFSTCVYRDGEFLGNITRGSLAEQLAKVAKDEWSNDE